MKLWENAWEEFTPFLRFDTGIRRIVCTMNAIEPVTARIRRAVKARGHFPNEQAALGRTRLINGADRMCTLTAAPPE